MILLDCNLPVYLEEVELLLQVVGVVKVGGGFLLDKPCKIEHLLAGYVNILD